MIGNVFSVNKEAIRVIYLHVKKHRKDFLFLGALSIVSAVANSIVPFLVGHLIDNITTPDLIFAGTIIAMPIFALVLGVWFAAKIIADIVDRQITIYSERLDALVQAEYMTAGIGKIFELPMSFHKSNKMGEIFDRINRASGFLSQIISKVIVDLAPQFLSIAIALVISFIINPLFAFILTGAMLLYAFILGFTTPGLAGLQRSMHKAYSDAYGDAYEAVSNATPIKQAGTEKHEARKHERGFMQAVFLYNKLYVIWQNLNFYQRLLVSLTQLSIFILSIFFIRAGLMTIGELVMFNGYAAMLFGPFVVLGRNWQTIQNGLAAVEWAESVLQTEPEIYEPENALILSGLTGRVEFQNVSLRYSDKEEFILKDVSFNIEAGKVVALVGESGVGKTTLIDLISLYHYPVSGKIYIDGHDITTLDLRWFRSQIGVVPQEPVLFNDTVKNNIKYGRFGTTDKEVSEAARAAYADEFIENFPDKYEQVVGERGVKLSTGQKQRIAIARAMLRDPKILILDEPTSALDARSEKFIISSLEKLMRGRTTFIIAHRLSTVRKADIIFVLDKGKIAELGKHDDLIKIPGGVYRRLYDLQIGLQ